MSQNALEISTACHACGEFQLELATQHARFHRVTSDCKPWPSGGNLARCLACGFVQTPVTPQWHDEVDQIYADYTIYHQSCGAEQNVFGSESNEGRPRSERLIQALRNNCALPETGRLLDIGCGNGSFLSAWSQLLPGWTLCGSEVNEKYKVHVEQIRGVEKLYTCGVPDISGSFDVISLVHVLEHIPGPLDLLRQVRKKLKPDGLLFIEVPDCEQNVFMLLVADHCSHFSPLLLASVVAGSGFEVLHATNSWITKEVSLVARRNFATEQTVSLWLPEADSLRVFGGWKQLELILAKVEPLTKQPNFGLFGTAIAATWLDAQTRSAARFFVDEDKNRIGRKHLGRPILSPVDLPSNATVFVALPQPLAGLVAERLNRLDLHLQVVIP